LRSPREPPRPASPSSGHAGLQRGWSGLTLRGVGLSPPSTLFSSGLRPAGWGIPLPPLPFGSGFIEQTPEGLGRYLYCPPSPGVLVMLTLIVPYPP